jgi:anti-sigma-K factor RskA
MLMNLAKAREHFSAYYEGSLEGGLKETFERALRSDAQIQAEYRAFERVMADLNLLGEAQPEANEDLHEEIARRLDRHIFERKRQARAPLFGIWKSLALGGLATVALVTAVLQLQSQNQGGPIQSGVVGGAPSEKLALRVKDGVY